MVCLYRFEAKGIQAFILRTNKLREIKGGSRLVEELSQPRAALLEALGMRGEVQELGSAAGGANLGFPREEDARRFASVWPLVVDQYAPGLTVVQGWADVPRHATQEEVAGAWQDIRAMLARQRNVQPPELPEAGPLCERAPRSGLPAAGFVNEPGGRRVLVDRGLARMSEAGRVDRGGRADESDPVGRRLAVGLNWAWNLDEHLPASDVAVVHLDGNDLGQRVVAMTPERLNHFSAFLSQATEESARSGLARCLELLGLNAVRPSGAPLEVASTGAAPPRFPGRPIVLGGDDVTILVRADLAIPFVEGYLHELLVTTSKPDAQQALGGSPVTACAGVAFVKKGYPFARAAELAEELCSFAKERLRGSGPDGVTPSALAWHRVTSSMSGTWAEILAHGLSRQDESGARVLSMLPFTWGEQGASGWERLEVLREAIGGLPRSDVRTLVDWMLDSPRLAERQLRRIEAKERARGSQGEARWTALVDALDAFRPDAPSRGAEGSETGWIETAEGRCTPLHDALVLETLRARSEA